MNFHVQRPTMETTRAAEGLPRRAWTVAEIEEMVAKGIIAENERFELIGGEIVPMSPKGMWHENLKRALNIHWARALPAELTMLTETTLHIDRVNFREPDFVFWPAAIAVRDLAPRHLTLLVELSDSSLDYDLGNKAATYAELGIADYWVIDARRLVTRLHRAPSPSGYGERIDLPHDARLLPLGGPALAVCLRDLDLEPVMD